MKVSLSQCKKLSHSSIWLLIMLMLTIASTSLASPYTYTYTGVPFEVANLNYILPTPSSYNMTVKFTTEGEISVGYYPFIYFTMEDGEHFVSSYEYGIYIGNFQIYSIGTNNAGQTIPLTWQFTIQGNTYTGMEAYWTSSMEIKDGEYSGYDEASEIDPHWSPPPEEGDPMMPPGYYGYAYYKTGDPIAPSWKVDAPVPLPASIILLVSGLVSLIATKKRKRNQ